MCVGSRWLKLKLQQLWSAVSGRKQQSGWHMRGPHHSWKSEPSSPSTTSSMRATGWGLAVTAVLLPGHICTGCSRAIDKPCEP